MFSLNRNFIKIYPNINNLARFFSVNSNNVKNGFSDQKHAKILETLNESSPEELSKYNIPLGHIQNLTNWKSKNGPFKSLNEVLEIEGFGEQILKDFDASLRPHNDSKQLQTKPKSKKRRRDLMVPDISFNILSSLNSAVAIHLEPTGIGWARLEKQDNTLTSWTCENFSSLPQKMMSVDTFNLAINILRKTPPADMYIFEAPNNIGLQAQAKQATVTIYNQKIELISMLLALINTSVTHNTSLQKLSTQEPLKAIENRVFYLRSNIPARLFGTLIGSEKVSAVTAINILLENNVEVDEPLNYTPVIFDENLRRIFFNQSSMNKELLAQALMLGVSFMDLCVRKKTRSYEALNFKKGKKTHS